MSFFHDSLFKYILTKNTALLPNIKIEIANLL